MDAVEVIGALALFAAVTTAVSWWSAGRRGVQPLLDRSRDRTLDEAEALYVRGPGSAGHLLGGTGGIGPS